MDNQDNPFYYDPPSAPALDQVVSPIVETFARLVAGKERKHLWQLDMKTQLEIWALLNDDSVFLLLLVQLERFVGAGHVIALKRRQPDTSRVSAMLDRCQTLTVEDFQKELIVALGK